MVDDTATDDTAFKVLWTVALVAGVAALILIGAYYWRHPERSVVSDFDRRATPTDSVQSSSDTPSGEDVETGPGVPPGSEAGAA